MLKFLVLYSICMAIYKPFLLLVQANKLFLCTFGYYCNKIKLVMIDIKAINELGLNQQIFIHVRFVNLFVFGSCLIKISFLYEIIS